MKQLKPAVYQIDATDKMLVPIQIYGSEKIVKAMQGDKSLIQAKNMAMLPGIIGKSIVMPDAHQGYGFPIGGVAAFDAKTGIVCPGGIGFDINCGMRAHATNLDEKTVTKKIDQLLDLIYKKVPVGQGAESTLKLSHDELDIAITKGMAWAKEKGFATADDVIRTESSGCLDGANASFISPTAKKRAKNQLGTLGAGNHFIEIQVVDQIFDTDIAKKFQINKVGQIIVMVHSGSRGLGHQTCTEYLRAMEDAFIDIADTLPERDLIYAPITSELAKKYIGAMNACANYAWLNRFMMAYHVGKAFEEVFGKVEYKSIYDVAHNIAKFETHLVNGKKRKVFVHRKGATRAFSAGSSDLPKPYVKTGHPVLIPGSMGTPSFILVGTDTAMADTFGSIAHGSGRVMSRSKAIATINGSDVAKKLNDAGIHLKVKDINGISDEAPAVYKDSIDVVDSLVQSGIARKIVQLRPLGVIKG